jgi:hypothetical protein
VLHIGVVERFDEVVGEEAGLRISAGSAEKECVCARSAPDELLLRGMVRSDLACVLEEFEQTAPEARLAPAVWNVLLVAIKVAWGGAESGSAGGQLAASVSKRHKNLSHRWQLRSTIPL